MLLTVVQPEIGRVLLNFTVFISQIVLQVSSDEFLLKILNIVQIPRFVKRKSFRKNTNKVMWKLIWKKFSFP